MTIKTNEVLVIRAAHEVEVAVNGENKWVGWDEIRAASRQSDQELAQVYRRILAEAEDMAATGPVVVSVHQDSTNVWWVCTVTALYGGGPATYPKRADEGGTNPNQLCAALEAADICDRLGKRVARRVGFDAAKARAKRDEIFAR